MDDPLTSWGRPLVLQQDSYWKQKRGWDVAAAAVFLITTLICYLSQKFVLIESLLVGVILAFVVSVVGSIQLKAPKLNPAEDYAVRLVRIIDLADNLQHNRDSASLDKFESAVSDLVRRIDADITRSRDSFAAAKTLKILQDLRQYLARLVTAIKFPQKTIPIRSDGLLAHHMEASLAIIAENLRSSHELGGTVDHLLKPIAELPEDPLARNLTWSSILRRWHNLPASRRFAIILLSPPLAMWLLALYFTPGQIQQQFVTLLAATLTWFGAVLFKRQPSDHSRATDAP